jgi:hypothetical protein
MAVQHRFNLDICDGYSRPNDCLRGLLGASVWGARIDGNIQIRFLTEEFSSDSVRKVVFSFHVILYAGCIFMFYSEGACPLSILLASATVIMRVSGLTGEAENPYCS